MKDIKKAFTLIELMIVITIIWTMMGMAYAPYSYFQKKAQVKIAAKEISRTISESRNMAIHWVESSSWNLSIGIYFETLSWSLENNEIKIYWYPYEFWTGSKVVLNDDFLINTINIQKDIGIDNIWIEDNEENVSINKNALFLFSAITWEWNYFYFDWGNRRDLVLWENNKINIEFSYRWNDWNLEKVLKYYTKTHISDY